MDCSQCISNSFHYVGRNDGPECIEWGDKLPKRVIATDTGEIYGTDTTLVLAFKFAALFITNPIRLIPQIAYRIYDLLSGGFIHRAAINQTHVLKEFCITLLKFTLLPIGLIAREAICLLGFVFAFHARVFYGKVEQFFYMAPKDLFEAQPPLEMMGNITAPCMQPTSFYKENNLFRYWAHFRYNPNTCRSLIAQLTKGDPNFPAPLKAKLSLIINPWDDQWEAKAIADETRIEFKNNAKRTDFPYIEELGQLLKATKEALHTSTYQTKLQELTEFVEHRETLSACQLAIEELSIEKRLKELEQLAGHELDGLNATVNAIVPPDTTFSKTLQKDWETLFNASSTQWNPDDHALEDLARILTEAKEAVKKKDDGTYKTKIAEFQRWMQSHPLNGGNRQPNESDKRSAEAVLATEVLPSDDETPLSADS